MTIYTRLQKRWHLESINCNCKLKSSEYALGILFFPAMYFLLQRIRIVNYWLSWWKWGYCLNTTHKSVGSHRSRFMLSRCQRFCNRVYLNWGRKIIITQILGMLKTCHQDISNLLQRKRHLYLFDYPLILSSVFSCPNQILDIAR